MKTKPKKNTVLIVDDDPLIRDLMQEYLKKNGFEVNLASNKAQALVAITHNPDIVLLDIMLPDGNGLEIAQIIQDQEHRLPVILISAKGDDEDRIIGLKKGVDDYLPKPFNPLELLLRIQAILRRVKPTVSDLGKLFGFGEYEFNALLMALTRNGDAVPLTKTEKLLLHYFVLNPKICHSREQLQNALSQDLNESFDRSIDIHITRLRKKIEKNPKKPHWIVTQWGLGYSFNSEES